MLFSQAHRLFSKNELNLFVAQDAYDNFGLGQSNRNINSVLFSNIAKITKTDGIKIESVYPHKCREVFIHRIHRYPCFMEDSNKSPLAFVLILSGKYDVDIKPAIQKLNDIEAKYYLRPTKIFKVENPVLCPDHPFNMMRSCYVVLSHQAWSCSTIHLSVFLLYLRNFIRGEAIRIYGEFNDEYLVEYDQQCFYNELNHRQELVDSLMFGWRKIRNIQKLYLYGKRYTCGFHWLVNRLGTTESNHTENICIALQELT